MLKNVPPHISKMWSGDQIPIHDIFFVYLLDAEGRTDRVIVFCHDTVKDTDELFSETQLEYFESEEVEIVVSKQMMYKEDSVATIFQKIRHEIGTNDGMYLFTEDRRDVMRGNEVIPHSLSYPCGLQYSVAYGIDLGDHPVGKAFSAAQWSSLLEGAQVKTIFVPVGYQNVTFLANPFSVLEEEPLASSPAMQKDVPFLHFSTTSTNIYVCLKQKVSEYARNQGLENLVSMYFPPSSFASSNPSEENALLVDEIHRFAWYDKENEKEQEDNRGIRFLENVKVTWARKNSTPVPLDAIFKRFHTSADVPCVTWFPKHSNEPLVRLFKPTAEAWSKTLNKKKTGSVLQFHLAAQRAILSIDAQSRLTLFVPQVATVSDIRFPERIIQQINQILHSLSMPKWIMMAGASEEQKDVMTLKPWQESCHFDYSLTLPSSIRFEPLPEIPLFDTLKKTVSSRVLTLHDVPLLEYVPILDNYLNYVLKQYTTTANQSSEKAPLSFWAPPPVETDEMVAEEESPQPMDLQKGSSNFLQKGPSNFLQKGLIAGSCRSPSNVLPFFRRRPAKEVRQGGFPVSQGFQVLERPATSVEESGDPLLGEPGWTVHEETTGNFLQIMAQYYAHERHLESPPGSDEFRNRLIQAMSLDRFLKYHNGNLPAFFRPPTQEAAEEFDTEPYQDSLFAKRLNLADPHQLDLFQSAVASYETFLEHLRSSPNVEYAHVWDLVTDANPELMPLGLNVVLIRHPPHGKSQFVCPTNAYSSIAPFDSAKNTAIVLQQDAETFVPILREPQQWTVKRVPKRIQELAEHCKPTPSLSADVYEFRSSVTASELQRIVTELDGIILVQQVVAPSSAKVIALQIKGLDAKQQALYVPCMPSAYLDDIPQITSEQATATLLSYEVTRDRLTGLAYASRGRIPCKPHHRVVKQGMRVGLVTEANEFVPTVPSSNPEDEDDTLEELEETMVVDGSKEFPEETPDPTFLALRLEGQFYQLYQHVVHGLLDDTRKTLWQRQLQSVSITHQNKVHFLEKEIASLVADHVHFQMLDPTVYKDIHDMMICGPESKDEPYCLASSDQTVFPKFNLVDPTVNNESMYALRLADELVRVRRTQHAFLQHGQPFNGSTNADYNLADDEVVVPWSALAKPLVDQTLTVWDTATPELSTTSPVEMMDAVEFVQECILDPDRRIGGFWRKCFARPTTETTFQPSCTLAPLLFVAQKHRDTPLSIESARRVLWKAYASYFDPHNTEKYKEHTVLLELLHVKDAEEIRKRILEDTEYNLNDVDWWVFCQSLHIPAFLIWVHKKQNREAWPWLRLYAEPAETTSYFFIQKHRKQTSFGRYSIVNRQFTMSELNTTALRDDQDRLVIQEI